MQQWFASPDIWYKNSIHGTNGNIYLPLPYKSTIDVCKYTIRGSYGILHITQRWWQRFSWMIHWKQMMRTQDDIREIIIVITNNSQVLSLQQWKWQTWKRAEITTRWSEPIVTIVFQRPQYNSFNKCWRKNFYSKNCPKFSGCFDFRNPKRDCKLHCHFSFASNPPKNLQTLLPLDKCNFSFPRWNRVFSSHPMWRGVAATARCFKLSQWSTLSQLRHFSREPADGSQGGVRMLKNAAGEKPRELLGSFFTKMGVIFEIFSGDELFVGHSIIFEMLKFKGVSWGQNDRGHVSFQGSKLSPTWSFQSDRPMVGSNLGNVSLVIWTKSTPNKTQAKNAFKIVVLKHLKAWWQVMLSNFFWMMIYIVSMFVLCCFDPYPSVQLPVAKSWHDKFFRSITRCLRSPSMLSQWLPLVSWNFLHATRGFSEGFWGQSADVFCDLKTPSLVLQGSFNYPLFWGGIKQCKHMAVLRDYPCYNTFFGLVMAPVITVLFTISF